MYRDQLHVENDCWTNSKQMACNLEPIHSAPCVLHPEFKIHVVFPPCNFKTSKTAAEFKERSKIPCIIVRYFNVHAFDKLLTLHTKACEISLILQLLLAPKRCRSPQCQDVIKRSCALDRARQKRIHLQACPLDPPPVPKPKSKHLPSNSPAYPDRSACGTPPANGVILWLAPPYHLFASTADHVWELLPQQALKSLGREIQPSHRQQTGLHWQQKQLGRRADCSTLGKKECWMVNKKAKKKRFFYQRLLYKSNGPPQGGWCIQLQVAWAVDGVKSSQLTLFNTDKCLILTIEAAVCI